MTLQEEITIAINKHCAENVSNTPDFILAQFLMVCLSAFNNTTIMRDKWHSSEAIKKGG
jgi:hypothetical protein